MTSYYILEVGDLLLKMNKSNIKTKSMGTDIIGATTKGSIIIASDEA